jgi:hypothetical protein
MQPNDSLKTSKDDASRLETSRENPKYGITHGVLAWDPGLLAYFYMQCRAKAVVDAAMRADPDSFPTSGLSPRRRYTSRKLNLTPAERKQLADGLRAARRKIRARRLLYPFLRA